MSPDQFKTDVLIILLSQSKNLKGKVKGAFKLYNLIKIQFELLCIIYLTILKLCVIHCSLTSRLITPHNFDKIYFTGSVLKLLLTWKNP